LPALALTYLFDSVGIYIDPASYTGLGIWPEPFASPLSLLPAAFFLNEIWFFPVTPLSNTPVWSLGFEGWYYFIFGTFVFLRGKTRWLASGCLTTIAGPSIALLFPTWLLGAAAYHASRRYRISESVGWILFAAPIPILTVWLVTKPGKWLPVLPFELFRHSTEAIFFIVLAFAISLHFVGVSAVDARLKRLLMNVAAPIRAGAAYTLSIYLFHFPILLMVSSLLSKQPPGLPRASITGALTLVASVGLGMIFEPQRFRLRERLLNLFRRREAIPK
jgi:peptidoglycan/LPS O-acetylase OafA/YrhL